MSVAYYYREPQSRRERTAQDEQQAAQKQNRALETWRDGKAISKTPAELYLRSRDLLPDALLYPDSGDGWPEVLRWSDDLTRSPKPPLYRGLICAVNDAGNGLVKALHRIPLLGDGRPYLRKDGKKHKWSLGPIVGNAWRGSCWPDSLGRWGIAEGVETALATTQLFRFPVWAAISAGNMAHVKPPSWARHSHIFADHDESGIGLKAAAETLQFHRGLNLDARVLMADILGADMGDVLREAPYAN